MDAVFHAKLSRWLDVSYAQNVEVTFAKNFNMWRSVPFALTDKDVIWTNARCKFTLKLKFACHATINTIQVLAIRKNPHYRKVNRQRVSRCLGRFVVGCTEYVKPITDNNWAGNNSTADKELAVRMRD